MPAVNSGRNVIDSPPRSSNDYISFETTSVVSPIGPREHRGLLDRRHLDPLEAVQAAHAIERRDHRGEAVGVFPEQALRAPDGLNRRHRSAAKAQFRELRNQRVGCAGRSCSRWRRKKLGGGKNSLRNADHDRSAERVEQVRLVVERHIAGRVADPRLAVEDVVHLEPDLRAAQPRMLDATSRHVAGIGEQPQVERRQRREMQIVAGQRADGGAAAPVGAEPRAEAVVRPSGLRLDLVARGAAGRRPRPRRGDNRDRAGRGRSRPCRRR